MLWRIHHDNCEWGGNSCPLAIDESSSGIELYGEYQNAPARGICECVANCTYDCNVTIAPVGDDTNGTTAALDVTLKLFVSERVLKKIMTIIFKVRISRNETLVSNHTLRCLEHQPNYTTTPSSTTLLTPVSYVTTTRNYDTDTALISSSHNNVGKLFYIILLSLGSMLVTVFFS